LDRLISKFLVIPYDLELARVWARVMTQARSTGQGLEAGDGWIAATAVHRSISLVTHDKDLAGLSIPGLTVICHA
jgi:tRNA(fMet)-specific endonuclease VapC